MSDTITADTLIVGRLILQDENGRPRARLSVNDDGVALDLLDSLGTARLVFQVTDFEGVSIAARDAAGEIRAVATLDSAGRPFVGGINAQGDQAAWRLKDREPGED